MGNLTDTLPKPLLQVRGRPLIVWHILNLVRAGITEIVINHAYLGHMIEAAIGDGSRFGAKVTYSSENAALETAGGIAYARHLLGEAPFVAVASDIYCPHFDFSQVKTVLQDDDVWGRPLSAEKKDMAWLYLVRNPAHNENGDFALNLFTLSNTGSPRFTFSGIGVYRMEMFNALKSGEKAPLGALLRTFAERGLVGGEVYRGDWTDVGTSERLNSVNILSARNG